MTRLQMRISLLLLSLISAIFVGYSLVLEHHQNLDPCVLCLMQRYSMTTVALFAFIASRRVGKTGWTAIMGLMSVFAAFGLYFSGRQLWLQTLPPESTPSCMPSLEVLIHNFPWRSVVEAIFLGTGDCAHEQYRVLGLSLPAWGLLYFMVITMVSVGLIIINRNLSK